VRFTSELGAAPVKRRGISDQSGASLLAKRGPVLKIRCIFARGVCDRRARQVLGVGEHQVVAVPVRITPNIVVGRPHAVPPRGLTPQAKA
jgi:hypothetical protein